jgi:hypothetical protein
VRGFHLFCDALIGLFRGLLSQKCKLPFNR